MKRQYQMALIAFLAVVTLAVGTIWRFNQEMNRQINTLSTATSDSIQWFIAQSEVELLALRDTARQMLMDDTIPAQELRKRFDVLYSRLSTLESGQNFAQYRLEPTVAHALSDIRRMMDDAIPIIDSDDRILRAAVPDLIEKFQNIAPAHRTISLEGVRYFANISDVRRAAMVQTLRDMSRVIALLFAVLATTVLVLLFLVKSARTQNNKIMSARNRLNSLFETSIDAIVVADQDGIIQNYNSAAERIYGFTSTEAIGADIRDILTPPDRMEAVNALLDQMRNGRGASPLKNLGISQTQAKHKSGHLIPVEVSLSINRDKKGPLLVAFVRDVTSRVAAESELIEARDHALEGDRAKARMIATMNHEMRTPLNGVMGTLDLLKSTDLDDEQRRYIDAMDRSARLLLQHVNDALDASREYNREIEVKSRIFDPVSLAEDVLEGLRATAEKRGNTLAFQTHGEDNRKLVGDDGKIRQILVNLVGNAIKFTDGGNITIRLIRHGMDGCIEMQVSDTGSGIAKNDIDRIFDEFVTLGSFYDRKVEGTGLGLSIVKRLVGAMEGEIAVESEIGKGSSFNLRLKLSIAEEQTDIQQGIKIDSGSRHDGRRILLIEDNQINRLVAREMLKSYGCIVTEAYDGAEGVQQALTGTYDLVLMDISMPRMNGVVATRSIRKDGPNRSTPVIALTAHATPEDLTWFYDAGMSGSLIKPINRTSLKAILDLHLSVERQHNR
ncbi:ATP-binding protein [Paracoccus sp. JM45]|uniref:ATP-binding protein n=1 Tax=Paracoccus sp. JM45 TaxID=2283626 RepID=UPI000E6D2820|nr:ATP-binding protein [Paracoccus sp. JM45]RJE78973.1 response regulator [Paracoccus sp. JM45]